MLLRDDVRGPGEPVRLREVGAVVVLAVEREEGVHGPDAIRIEPWHTSAFGAATR